jgi:hypothetical protein
MPETQQPESFPQIEIGCNFGSLALLAAKAAALIQRYNQDDGLPD